jgi:hypothetical protein
MHIKGSNKKIILNYEQRAAAAAAKNCDRDKLTMMMMRHIK